MAIFKESAMVIVYNPYLSFSEVASLARAERFVYCWTAMRTSDEFQRFFDERRLVSEPQHYHPCHIQGPGKYMNGGQTVSSLCPAQESKPGFLLQI